VSVISDGELKHIEHLTTGNPNLSTVLWISQISVYRNNLKFTHEWLDDLFGTTPLYYFEREWESYFGSKIMKMASNTCFIMQQNWK
jgi:hypothetical protein